MDHHVWSKSDLSNQFTTNWRQGLPFAYEQLKLISFLIKQLKKQPCEILDFGCGGGFIGLDVHKSLPAAKITYLDASEPMIEQLRSALTSENCETIITDYSSPVWLDNLAIDKKYDLILCGFSLHYVDNSRKEQIYKELYSKMNQGGTLMILEHVSPEHELEKSLHDEYFIESLYQQFKHQETYNSRQKVRTIYQNRPQQFSNKLATLEAHKKWINNSGLVNFSYHMKTFQFALFSAMKSE